MSKILMQATRDRFGGINVRAVREDIDKAFREHRGRYGGSSESGVYFSEGGEAQSFLESTLPKRYHRDLENGYTVRWQMDPWEAGNLYGYDCHTVEVRA